MRTRTLFASLLAMSCSVYVSDLAAQVVRESDTDSLAAVLYSPSEPVYWTLKSSGGEILFASLSADIYRTMASNDHEEGSDDAAVDDEGGGCSGEDSGGSPFKFYIEVLDPSGDVLCRATRPAPPPGWQRDPRLACILPSTPAQVTYTVQVGLTVNEEHGETALSSGEMKPHPFLLDLSLRRIAPSGAQIQLGVAQSKNRL